MKKSKVRRTPPKPHKNGQLKRQSDLSLVLVRFVEKAMKANSWNLSDLSRKSGVSAGHLSRLLSGRRNHSPTLRSLERLSKVLGVPPWKLIKS